MQVSLGPKMKGVCMQKVADVAKYLSWMQRIFLTWLIMGFSIAGMAGAGVAPDLIMIPIGLVALASSVMMLVCTYRCASGSGRSGVLWLLGVIFFKLIALIILSYLTRKWLKQQGVMVHSLGLGYSLPEELPVETGAENLGFSRT